MSPVACERHRVYVRDSDATRPNSRGAPENVTWRASNRDRFSRKACSPRIRGLLNNASRSDHFAHFTSGMQRVRSFQHSVITIPRVPSVESCFLPITPCVTFVNDFVIAGRRTVARIVESALLREATFPMQLVRHSRPPARRLPRSRESGKTQGGNRRNKKGAKGARKRERKRERGR